jgi:hypothetical protein
MIKFVRASHLGTTDNIPVCIVRIPHYITSIARPALEQVCQLYPTCEHNAFALISHFGESSGKSCWELELALVGSTVQENDGVIQRLQQTGLDVYLNNIQNGDIYRFLCY